jgi:hypothetical protein
LFICLRDFKNLRHKLSSEASLPPPPPVSVVIGSTSFIEG